ncbi:unnamed protein product [Microthlaspi erraticum]|uniref:Uncharacterized protein n=1 Tax=Microthlaspi erraticum TaxID=1685480 RepID=A0A6D2JHF0_9BRAS|nr:unnamed protein product [Microthlaspi erraticum]
MIMEEVAGNLDQEAAGELVAEEEQLEPEEALEALALPTGPITRSQTKMLNQDIGRVLSRLSRHDQELKHSTLVVLEIPFHWISGIAIQSIPIYPFHRSIPHFIISIHSAKFSGSFHSIIIIQPLLASKCRSSTRGLSVGTIGRTVGLWPCRNGRGRMISWSAGVVGRMKIWLMVSRPDVGRFFPARTDTLAMVRENVCAAARLYSSVHVAWSCAAWRGRLWHGRPRALVSRVVMRDRPFGFGLWPRLQTDGSKFGRERNMRSSASRSARSGR